MKAGRPEEADEGICWAPAGMSVETEALDTAACWQPYPLAGEMRVNEELLREQPLLAVTRNRLPSSVCEEFQKRVERLYEIEDNIGGEHAQMGSWTTGSASTFCDGRLWVPVDSAHRPVGTPLLVPVDERISYVNSAKRRSWPRRRTWKERC